MQRGYVSLTLDPDLAKKIKINKINKNLEQVKQVVGKSQSAERGIERERDSDPRETRHAQAGSKSYCPSATGTQDFPLKDMGLNTDIA